MALASAGRVCRAVLVASAATPPRALELAAQLAARLRALCVTALVRVRDRVMMNLEGMQRRRPSILRALAISPALVASASSALAMSAREALIRGVESSRRTSVPDVARGVSRLLR